MNRKYVSVFFTFFITSMAVVSPAIADSFVCSNINVESVSIDNNGFAYFDLGGISATNCIRSDGASAAPAVCGGLQGEKFFMYTSSEPDRKRLLFITSVKVTGHLFTAWISEPADVTCSSGNVWLHYAGIDHIAIQ